MREPSPKRKRTLALQECTCAVQLVRAADSASNNLVEADDAVSDADFLNKMGIALRETKESRTELMKVRLGNLDNHQKTARLELESEATELTAIFSTIIRNMRWRIEGERTKRKGGSQPPKP